MSWDLPNPFKRLSIKPNPVELQIHRFFYIFMLHSVKVLEFLVKAVSKISKNTDFAKKIEI